MLLLLGGCELSSGPQGMEVIPQRVFICLTFQVDVTVYHFLYFSQSFTGIAFRVFRNILEDVPNHREQLH